MRLLKDSFITILPIFTFFALPGAQKCDRIKLGNDYYKRQLIASLDGYPTGITVDPRTENIFFILHKKNYTKGIHMLKHGALGIKEIVMGDDMIGQCVAIDVPSNVIYIGTNQGLVTFDPVKNEVVAERPIGDDDIRNIFIDKSDNQMYISTGPNHDIFKFVNGSYAVKRFERVTKAYSFVLDSRGNAFYEFVDGRIYFFATDLFEPIQYKGFSRELKYILRLNMQDEAIIAVKGSLYKLSIASVLPVKIGQLGLKITGIAFDTNNNIIVGTKGKIYRYKPVASTDPCPADDYFMATI